MQILEQHLQDNLALLDTLVLEREAPLEDKYLGDRHLELEDRHQAQEHPDKELIQGEAEVDPLDSQVEEHHLEDSSQVQEDVPHIQLEVVQEGNRQEEEQRDNQEEQQGSLVEGVLAFQEEEAQVEDIRSLREEEEELPYILIKNAIICIPSAKPADCKNHSLFCASMLNVIDFR